MVTKKTVKKHEIANISEELLVVCVASGDCSICNREARADHCSTEDIKETRRMTAEDLYDDGWRVRVSHEYQLRGLICPECLEGLK